MSPLSYIILLQLGYLIGSLSPSYFLGKVLHSVDIRELGTKNAGTVNAYKVLGLGPAIMTIIFDLSKGLFVMHTAYLLGAPPILVHLTACAAILGHVFPFYLNFRGGQGVATATAILIYYLGMFCVNRWLPLESLVFLAFCVFSFLYITKIGEFIGSVILPVLGISILVFSPSQEYSFFILSIIGYIWFIDMLNIHNNKLLPVFSKKIKHEINWRLFIRPAAILLAIYYLNNTKREALMLTGILTLIFLLLDFTRLLSKKINTFFFKKIKDLYKPKEYKKFSSMTNFLVAIFITFLLFEKSIAILATLFLIFGDFFSKFFGIYFGRTQIFQKSLEGSLAHFNACLLVGYLFLHFVSVPITVYLAGAFVATCTELLPMGIDDNLSVAILSASAMSAFQLF